MAAPPALSEERNALAPRVILTRLFARREVGDFARRLVPVELASAHVALRLLGYEFGHRDGF